MKDQLITEIQQKMLLSLNNEQMMKLKNVLEDVFHGLTISEEKPQEPTKEQDVAGRIYRDKTYGGLFRENVGLLQKSIEAMVTDIGKKVQQITTDDFRAYLTDYQKTR